MPSRVGAIFPTVVAARHCCGSGLGFTIVWVMLPNGLSYTIYRQSLEVIAMGKGKRSKEGQYIPLPYAQAKSAAWRSLSGSAVKLWVELHTRYNGGNNGKLILSQGEAAKALGMGKATIKRAFDELQVKGFIVLKKQGSWYSKRANEWQITTKRDDADPKARVPTNDWRSWQPDSKGQS